MKPCIVSLVLLAALAASLVAWDAFPRIVTVDPDTGKTGDVVSAKGENLGKAAIADLYLTDGTHDTKVKIAEQSDTELKFAIPPAVKAGRYHLMILTANKASMVEQPVVLTVE
jgi:hypothetical protein